MGQKSQHSKILALGKARSEGLFESLFESLLDICRTARKSGDDQSALEALSVAANSPDRLPSTDCRLLRQLGSMRREQCKLDSACDAFGLASCIAAVAGDRVQWARAETEFGLCLVEAGKNDQARDVLRTALAGLGRMVSQRRHRASAHLGLATVDVESGLYGAAESHYRRAESLAESQEDRAKILASLGRVQIIRGRLDDGIASLRDALTITPKLQDRIAIEILIEQFASETAAEGELSAGA